MQLNRINKFSQLYGQANNNKSLNHAELYFNNKVLSIVDQEYQI